MADQGKSRSRRQALAVAALGLAGASSAAADESWEPKKEKAGGPIRSGHLLFLGGIGGWYPSRRPDGPGDVQEQTRDALTTMKESLARAGSSMENVLKVQVSLVDPEKNWPAMNKVYAEFFQGPVRPSRSAVGVEFPDSKTKVEIEMIAWAPGGSA